MGEKCNDKNMPSRLYLQYQRNLINGVVHVKMIFEIFMWPEGTFTICCILKIICNEEDVRNRRLSFLKGVGVFDKDNHIDAVEIKDKGRLRTVR